MKLTKVLRPDVDQGGPYRRRPLRILSWWVVLGFAILVGAAIWISTLWLLFEADKSPPDQRAALRIEAIRTGLSVGAGTGAAAALLLAARRQWLQERAQAHQEDVTSASEVDAIERRITDLYTKAVDQLGSDKAAVRLGGLYALERLAQSHPSHRQTIVDVMCAYLRMPYVASLDSDYPADTTNRQTESHDTPGSQEELQVRRAAQKIITEHLYYGQAAQTLDPNASDNPFWTEITLDLTGATLIDFEFAGRRVEFAHFAGARFIGVPNFAWARFDKDVWFTGARFEQGGHFLGARFGRRAVFSGAVFVGKAQFTKARFGGMAFFERAKFDDAVVFDEAQALLEFDPSWGTKRTWPPGWEVGRLAEESAPAETELWGGLQRIGAMKSTPSTPA